MGAVGVWMNVPENPVLLALIGSPHGIKGEVRVQSFTQDPLALGDYGPFYATDGRAFTLAALRRSGSHLVAKFREIGSREEAAAVTRTELYVDRSALPRIDDDEEYYHIDLIGLRVQDDSGNVLGTVSAIHSFGSTDVIEFKQSGGNSLMIPFSRAAVPQVAIEAGFIRIDPVAAGVQDGQREGETRAPARGSSRRPRRPREGNAT